MISIFLYWVVSRGNMCETYQQLLWYRDDTYMHPNFDDTYAFLFPHTLTYLNKICSRWRKHPLCELSMYGESIEADVSSTSRQLEITFSISSRWLICLNIVLLWLYSKLLEVFLLILNKRRYTELALMMCKDQNKVNRFFNCKLRFLQSNCWFIYKGS